MLTRGYTNVKNVKFGMYGWTQGRLPYNENGPLELAPPANKEEEQVFNEWKEYLSSE